MENCSVVTFRHLYQLHSSNTFKSFTQVELGAIIITICMLLLENASSSLKVTAPKVITVTYTAKPKGSFIWKAALQPPTSQPMWLRLICRYFWRCIALGQHGRDLVTLWELCGHYLPLRRDGVCDQEQSSKLSPQQLFMSPAQLMTCVPLLPAGNIH